MKKTLLTLVLVAFATALQAAPVTVAQARKAAENFLRSRGCPPETGLTDVSAQLPYQQFYTFTFDEGFIIMSSDSRVQPVQAYSLDNTLATDNLPPQLSDWLEAREQVIAGALQYGIEDEDGAQSRWLSLQQGKSLATKGKASVAPLLKTQWAQDDPFNGMAPYVGSPDNRAVTGCVATAMAQIMRYWRYPASGYGTHEYTHATYGTLSVDFGAVEYDWDHMPNTLTSANSQQQKDAVATLMYHCGVSVDMNYSPSGSGAMSVSCGREVQPCAEYALVDHFRYSNSLRAVFMPDYKADEWTSLLKNELDHQRPILYCGEGSGAHAFVVDGYDSDDLMHINWGWGGTADGYFAVGKFKSKDFDYSQGNYALIGIQPAESFWGNTLLTVDADSDYGTVTGSGTYAFGERMIVSAQAKEGYRFAGWSDGNPYGVRYITATGGERALTARFRPLRPDTAYYGPCLLPSYSTGAAQKGCYWGVRYPAGSIPQGYGLDGVQFYSFNSAAYRIEVFEGSVDTEHRRHKVNYSVVIGREKRWHTVKFDSIVQLSGNEPVWVRFYNQDADKPLSVAYNCGNRDGRLWGEQLEADTLDNNCWMIRSLFRQPDSVTVGFRNRGHGVVMLEDGSEPLDEQFLAFALGDTLRLSLQAHEGEQLLHIYVADTDRIATVEPHPDAQQGHYIFQWPLADNTLVRTVFSGSESIESPAVGEMTVCVEDGKVIVSGAEGRRVELVDVMGRCTAQIGSRMAPGVYIVRVDGHPLQRVVVAR